VFAGARPSAALAEAQDKAAIFTDCMAGSEITEEAIIACAHQADPSVEWPFE